MTPSSNENELIAVAAGTKHRREAARAGMGARLDAIDWSVVAAILDRTRLTPTLGPKLIDIAGSRAPDPFRRKVAAAIADGLHRDALIVLVADQLGAALSDAGVAAAGLKGPQLAERIYGEPGRRLSSDIDLLVAPADLGRTVEVARGLGYGEPRDPLDAEGLPLLHLVLEHPQGTLPPVELHWRIHWYERRFAVERLLPPRADLDGWLPDPVDELAALLLFYARDGFTGLRQASDLAAWWDRFGEAVADRALGELAALYPELADAWAVAGAVAERVVGLPAARLGAGGGGLGRRAQVALLLADPRPYASEAQMFAEIGLIDGLLAPRGTRSAYLRRQVAPPRALLRHRATKARGARIVSPLGYGLRVLGRYALALGRLLHVPFTARARFSS